MPFYQSAAMSQTAHWIISLKDAGMTVALYVAVALILRNSFWGRHTSRRGLVPLMGLGFLWAVVLEYYHVRVAGSWAYAAAMPLLPGLRVGLWPVLQMMVLPMIALFLARKHLFV